MRRQLVLVAGILLFSFMVSCTPKPQEQILGKWKRKGDVYEFFEDGTMSIKLSDGREGTANWIIFEDGRLKMTFQSHGTSHTLPSTLHFSGKDSLKLMFEDGSKELWTRAK